MSWFKTFKDWATGNVKPEDTGNSGAYLNPYTGNRTNSPTSSGGQVRNTNIDYSKAVASTSRAIPKEMYTTYGTTGLEGSGGGGAGYVDPEAAQKDTLKQQIRDRYNIFQDVFNGLFGQADAKAKEQTDLLNQNYERQQKDLGDQYQNTAKQTAYMMGARGIGNSSYNQDAQETAGNVYQSTLGDIAQNQQQGLGQIGNWLAQQKQGLNNRKSAFDRNIQQLDQYGLQDLNNLSGQVDQGLQQAQNDAPNYYTQGQNIAELSKVTPVQNTGTAQLASKLQALVTSSAPVFAKRQIAQGLVKAANLTDPAAVSYWQNSFEDLLKNNGQA